MKLTEWYSGEQKPVRVGVYNRKYESCVWRDEYFSFWDGKKWRGGGWNTVDRCLKKSPFYPDDEQNIPWRGIAK